MSIRGLSPSVGEECAARGLEMTQAKILIVEDEPAVSRTIRRSLERVGFTVTGIASTAEQALDAAKLEAPPTWF